MRCDDKRDEQIYKTEFVVPNVEKTGDIYINAIASIPNPMPDSYINRER